MKFAIIENGIVANISLSDSQLESNWIPYEEGVNIGWGFDGQKFIPPQPPSLDQIKSDVIDATQQRLDNFARTRQYGSILSLCTYATDSNQNFAAEGQYGVRARGETWAKLYSILDEVKAGTRPAPEGYSGIEAELPALTWPT